MDIIPVRQEYVFSVASHTMRAVAEHIDDKRHLNYYFDEKLVVTKIIEDGDYYTDDDCISEVVEEYRKSKKDVYSDLLNRHIDKIVLTSKSLEVKLVNYGIVINAKVKIVKDYYEIELNTDNEENSFNGKFKASDFSEVLEKMRLFTSTLSGVSSELADKINILSNDKIEEIVKWKE
ncbi:MAG: hypothetical protein MJ107_07570 [Lachnospiraceae bacterium]|nr:hypothetical protein [Lachnospiraceae bacterium]